MTHEDEPSIWAKKKKKPDRAPGPWNARGMCWPLEKSKKKVLSTDLLENIYGCKVSGITG